MAEMARMATLLPQLRALLVQVFNGHGAAVDEIMAAAYDGKLPYADLAALMATWAPPFS